MFSQIFDQEEIQQILNDIDYGIKGLASTRGTYQDPQQIKLLDYDLDLEKSQDNIHCVEVFQQMEPEVFDIEVDDKLPFSILKDEQFEFQEMPLQKINTQDKQILQSESLDSLIKTIAHEEQEIEDDQDIKRLIFNEKIIRDKNQKNANFPKFLLRLLETQFQKVGMEIPQQWKQLQYISRKIKKLKYRNCNKNISVLCQMLKDDQKLKDFQRKRISRKIMNKILRQKSFKQILVNNHVHCKKTYLIAAKVYSLRCMNSQLTNRIKSI